MNYDPKLREAMFEIEGILAKHDVAGFVALNSKTHGEFKFCWPTWTVIFPEGNEGFRFKFKKGVDDHKKLEWSTGLILSLEQLTGFAFIGLEKLGSALKEKMEVEHWDGPVNNDGRGDA